MILVSRKKIGALFLLVSLSSSGFCSDLGFDYIKEGHVLAEVGGYGAIEGQAQHINIETRIGNDFTLNSTTGGNVLVGLGYDHFLKKYDGFDVSYGLSLFYLGPSSVNGNILLENQLTNFTYSYKTSHLPLYGMLKFSHQLQNTGYKLLADVGIGPNFMFLNDYKETPLLANSIPDNAFLSTNAITFSVTAGIGFEMKNVFGRYPLRCGYRFYYLGEGALNHDNKVENSLSTGATYANAGVCSV